MIPIINQTGSLYTKDVTFYLNQDHRKIGNHNSG